MRKKRKRDEEKKERKIRQITIVRKRTRTRRPNKII